jgi:hypothetical protein
MEDGIGVVSKFYGRVLGRALETVGSLDGLAQELGVSVEALEPWLNGQQIPPHDVFSMALRIDGMGPLFRRKSAAS